MSLEMAIKDFKRAYITGYFIKHGEKPIKFYKSFHPKNTTASYKLGFSLSSFFRNHMSLSTYEHILQNEKYKDVELTQTGPKHYIN